MPCGLPADSGTAIIAQLLRFEGGAPAVIGNGYDPGSKTEAEVYREVVARHLGESATNGKSLGYCEAAFDHLTDRALARSEVGTRADGLDDANLQAARDRADAARDTFLLRLDNMWMSPSQRASVAIGPRTYEEHCEYLSHRSRGQAAANLAVAKYRASRAA